jgi:hypothetical protein
VLFLDAATGAIRGRAALPSGDGSGVTAAAFRPDGSELAALAGGKLVRWDLASDGAVIQESPASLTIPCDRMVYHGPDHLMLAGHWLYDIAHQSIVWAYPNGMPSPVSPDGAHWYAAAAENIGAAFLKAIAVPNRDVTQAESLAFGADAKPNAQVKALLRRGATVAIRVEGGPPRQADEFRAKLIEAFRGRLAAIGVKTADEAPVRLVIRFTERDVPGAKIEIRLSRPGAGAMETREIPARGIDWEVALADPTGTPIVLHAEKGGPLGFGFLNIPPGETDLEGIVRLRLYESVRDQRVVRIDLPYFVARRAGGALLVPGTTDLGHPRTTFASTGPIFAPPPPP